jgi:hypothetical protein
MSPLAIREVEFATGRPCLTTKQLRLGQFPPEISTLAPWVAPPEGSAEVYLELVA